MQGTPSQPLTDMSMSPIARLRQLMEEPEENFSLAEAALLIAAEEYPQLDTAIWLHKLDALGQTLKRRLRADISTADTILSLNRYLFKELGFGPNLEDYYDPRNSFLHEVIERKVGIPLTLSIVYIEIGQRIGLPLEGVSFPGNFLVKCIVRGDAIVIDPYAKGISLSLSDLQRRLQQLSGGETPSKARVAGMLQTATKKDVLVRMLRNLKGIYLHYNQMRQALSAVDRILLIVPDEAQEVRDRGTIYQKLECFRAALADFQRYLDAEPGAEDADAIRDRIIELQHSAARLN